MNYIDIFLLVPLLWGAFKGFKKGLIIEVVSLIALGLGIWGGVHFSDFSTTFLADKLDDKYIPLTAFLITFIVIVVVVYFIGKILEKIIDVVQLKLVNKLLGACFGLLKFALIISIVLFIVDRYNKKFNFLPVEIKEKTILYGPLVSLPKVLIPAIEQSKLYQSNKELENLNYKQSDSE